MKTLTRREMLLKLGIIREGPYLQPRTIKAMQDYERTLYEKNLESSPHGRAWHTSFHGSAYPGGDKPCKRQLLYTLMDIPDEEPTPPRLRGQGEVGKAVEYLIVHRWAHAGILLGVEPPKKYGDKMPQVGFEIPSLWLTGSLDAILDIRPDWDAVLPVDVKTKDHEIIKSMQVGSREYDERHYLQLQAYIFLCIYYHEKMGWDKLGLQPARGGVIYYASRQDPTFTAEFYVPADGGLMADANAILASARDNFLADFLPPRDKSWRWTELPCKWCKFKKHACKPDDRAKVTQLSRSLGVDFAKSIRENYDPERIRKDVTDRWEQ